MIPAAKPNSLVHQIFGSPGYSTAPYLLPHELAMLREWIESRGLNHEQVKDKTNRLFSSGQVQRLKQFGFLQTARRELGDFTLSDVVVGKDIQRGREEAYFRIVRPQEVGDVGPMHRDTEHHARSPGLHSPDEMTVKCWIAVETEPGKNGLELVPDSHRGEATSAILLRLAPGEIVMFNENVLHRGVVNAGQKPRVSVEVTLCFPRGK